MNLLRKFRRRGTVPGRLYDGPATWCDDYALVPRPGFYALTDDGKTVLPNVPLVCVDDAPGDSRNGACHYEYAGPKDNPQRRADNTTVPAGTVVELEVHAEGKGTLIA